MSKVLEPFGFVKSVAEEDDAVHESGGAMDLLILAGALGLDVATLPAAAVYRLGDDEVDESG
jgi:hypothetical protein